MKILQKLILTLVMLFNIFIFINTTSFAKTTNINLNSPSCILMETSTGEILYEKNAHEKRFPASTTKIMTAILTLEHCNLNEKATVSHDAIFTVPVSYSHASLKEGEELTVEELLNVLLIPSANDAANVLAEHISGSVSEFAKLMNQKAKEIGCLNTNFVNPNGVHNNKHVSTAYDLALMGNYAMKNSTFRSIVKKTSYSLPATTKYNKTDRNFTTTNDLLIKNNSKSKDNYYYSATTGIKTGYTSDAGSCIVASAKKDNMEVIAVVLGGTSTTDGLSGRNLDCITLFNYAFNNYSLNIKHKQNSILKQLDIKGASSETPKLDVLVKDTIELLENVPNLNSSSGNINSSKNNSDSSTIEPKIEFRENLEAPISIGSVVGKIAYEVDGKTYSSELIAGNTVYRNDMLPSLLKILLLLVVLIILYWLLCSKDKKKRKGSKKPFMSKQKKRISKNKNNKSSGKHSRGSGHFKLTGLD